MQYLSPLVPQRADPYLYKFNKKYYFTATCPEYDHIELRCADTINGIATATPRTIWVRHNTGKMASHIWAPEIHYIMGKWVIYFAAGELPGIRTPRQVVHHLGAEGGNGERHLQPLHRRA